MNINMLLKLIHGQVESLDGSYRKSRRNIRVIIYIYLYNGNWKMVSSHS